MNYPNNSEFANVMKYVSPNFNPGIRRWHGVDPERHIVEDIDKPFYSYIPPKGFPMINPQVEDFGFQQKVTISKKALMKLLMIIIVVYLVWTYFRK